MLILNNEEIDSLFSVEIALRSLEKAYKEQAEGRAINRPRTDLYLPGKREGAETGEPLAIFPDGVVQRMRVAGTSALAAREMARQNASVLGIFGSGWQAGAHVPAFCAVRKFKQVKVYSPTRVNRESFTAEMTTKVGVPVIPVERPEEMADADVLAAAANAITRVVHPDWVKPGIHITCVKDCELGNETIRKADRVVIHARKFAPENYIVGFGDEKIEAHDPIDFLKGERGSRDQVPKAPFWVTAPELKEVMGGKIPGRTAPEEITCFINNIGLGIQFAALGAAVYREARSRGVGREIPTDWFLESVHP